MAIVKIVVPKIKPIECIEVGDIDKEDIEKFNIALEDVAPDSYICKCGDEFKVFTKEEYKERFDEIITKRKESDSDFLYDNLFTSESKVLTPFLSKVFMYLIGAEAFYKLKPHIKPYTVKDEPQLEMTPRGWHGYWAYKLNTWKSTDIDEFDPVERKCAAFMKLYETPSSSSKDVLAEVIALLDIARHNVKGGLEQAAIELAFRFLFRFSALPSAQAAKLGRRVNSVLNSDL